jgi:hypothetical protein
VLQLVLDFGYDIKIGIVLALQCYVLFVYVCWETELELEDCLIYILGCITLN